MLILNETEIRDLTNATAAYDVVRDAFRALHRGEATLPPVISLPFTAPEGLAHIKAGHLHADEVWTVKVSTDVYPDDGSTLHGGVMLVFSTVDGSLAGVLVDNGYLTDLRTGGAGAVAADLLARPDASTVAIVGAGNQARFQLEALLQVRRLETVHVVARSSDRAQALAGEVDARWNLPVRVFDSVREAVCGADVVITVTPSSTPLLQADWLEEGMHVTAVGADEPTKQELDPGVLRRADVIAVDDRSQAARLGELHHAVAAGVVQEAGVVTLGELLAGTADGRTRPEDITVADLTGLGVQDAAIAAFVVREAVRSSAARLGAR